jgi:bacteriocin-like protein
MSKISKIQTELTTKEQLTNEELENIKGGLLYDDKRRRPGGSGTTSRY